jgi:uncharacterized protein YaeQ
VAIKATIYKAEIQISDMDRHYYQNHHLTLARHPSETDERLMVRILSFVMHANEDLKFTKGISTDDEPDLWQINLSNEIELWIDLGQLDEKRIRKACHRAKRVIIYTYQTGSAKAWWQQNENKANRFDNLTVIYIPDEVSLAMAQMCHRGMQLQYTIQDGEIWLSDNKSSVQINPIYWKQ